MKNVQKVSPQRRLVRSLIVVVAAFLLITPAVAKAAPVTQLQYLQWLVQVSGDSGQFNNNSPPSAYVQWAQAKGIVPKNGWSPNHPLVRDDLAHTLVQLLGLSTKKNSDDVKTLLREGINLLDALPDSNVEVDRKNLVFIIDDGLFRMRLSNASHSPHKPPHPPGPHPHPHPH
jgi:hypothetical protein